MSEDDARRRMAKEAERRVAAGLTAPAPLATPPPGLPRTLSPGGRGAAAAAVAAALAGPDAAGGGGGGGGGGASSSGGVPDDFGGLCECGIHFVTRDFFSESISAGARQPEGAHHVALHSFHAAPGLPRASPSPGPQSGRGKRGSGEKRGRRSGGSGSGVASPGDGAPAAAGGGAAEWGAPLPANVRLPAPEEICLPGQAWGEGGRWIEPWDEAAARASVRELMEHWHM
jgi:hypothetical protein